MKLRSYQLCRWCDGVWHGRRKWLWLGANALALLLSALLSLMRLMLPLLLLLNAALALYVLHRHHAFGTAYQRRPRPGDAMCETVLIDASLIGQGTRLRAAAQPVDAAEALSMRLGSGALLLGAAMTLTADALDPADRSAILSAVQSLNIKPDRMRSQYPVLRREKVGEVTVVTVRDGMSERRYYLGESGDVADLCASIWEGHTRPLDTHDHLRIADTAAYIIQGNCRVLAWATALAEEEPIFLGMAGLGEEILLHAVQDVNALRAMGLTVMLDAGDAPDADLTSLRALLDLPDHHARADIHLTRRMLPGDTPLGVTCQAEDSLLEPVQTLRHRFRTIEDTLRRFFLMLGLPMLLCALMAPWGAGLCAAAMLIFTAIYLGADLNAPLPRRQTMIVLALTALIAKAILLTQPLPLGNMAGGIITLWTAFACARRLCGGAFRWKGWSLLLPGAAAVYSLAVVLAALSHGAAMLLPLGFAGLIAGVMVLLLTV